MDLEARAIEQHDKFTALATRLRGLVAAARQERDRRVDDPAAVPLESWRAQLGVAEHFEVAREAVAANTASETAARAGLSASDTPAEAGAGGGTLADVLVEGGGLAVALRDAQERTVVSTELLTALTALSARTDALVTASTGRVSWAAAQQKAVDDLLVAVAAPPFDTIVAEADDVATGAAFTLANGRVEALVPPALLERARQRILEADARVDHATRQRAKASDASADLALLPQLESDVRAAEQTLEAAVRELTDYVARAPGQLAAATERLVSVAAHPALTTAQELALDEADRADAVDAADKEADLATALDAELAAKDDVDDAILTAVDTDPDADPATAQAVIDARAALDDPAIQDPLDAARAAYGTTARRALDDWEVEVPPSLWQALVDLATAERSLEQLRSQSGRDQLITAVNDATDVLGDALDARDVRWRAQVEIERILAERRAQEQAAIRTADVRFVAYARGDGASGRTTPEL